MKKLTMFLKISLISLSLAIVSGILPIQQTRVAAMVAGCADTSCVNHGWIFDDCRCPNNDCNGCFVQNGTTGCGVCSKGANEIE